MVYNVANRALRYDAGQSVVLSRAEEQDVKRECERHLQGRGSRRADRVLHVRLPLRPAMAAMPHWLDAPKSPNVRFKLAEVRLELADQRPAERRMVAAFNNFMRDKVRLEQMDMMRAPTWFAERGHVTPNRIAGGRRRWKDGHHFADALKRRGYVVLGAGYFSTVFKKPGSDRVVKVCHRPDNWLDYVLWATKAGYAGTFAPRIFSYRRYNQGRDGEFYVAVMEELAETVDRLSCRVSDGRAVRAAAHLRSYININHDQDGVAADRLFAGALRFAMEFRIEFRGANFDLHMGNWMVRFDGSLVCTDPVSHGRSTAPARMRTSDLLALQAA
ncbi:hypothetical protein [Rhodopseudomonas palustris]|uniref:hypothetical protein n=1 Tax=Rhodopseudomonas palustris TaxID=1076 RepID=UPI0021F3BE4F|nr:hypothetical protein [Rhodopseudomonas palustris]UYO52484.1 hypothetical protein KQX61_18070 [Rhodopseudomonas palustris]